jgi:GDP-D-mannose 3', 5'-epimerase
MSKSKAIVCGAGGFIGSWLVEALVAQGWWVRGVDQHRPFFKPTAADEFVIADLRDPKAAKDAIGSGADVVFQLAADMGGMDFIGSAECDIVLNSTRINFNVLEAAAQAKVGTYFLSSSVCIYRDMAHGESVLDEEGAYPAQPDNEYGWEKLYAERAVYTFARHHGFRPRVARFENCYGPFGTWRGGREKVPAAMSRKIAEAADGGTIDVYGGGSTVRSFVYVADLVQAVIGLVKSDEDRPTNIGVDEQISIADLVKMTADIAGKDIAIRPVDGPLGVTSRNFSHERIRALGWTDKVSLREGMERTYEWVAKQVADAQR